MVQFYERDLIRKMDLFLVRGSIIQYYINKLNAYKNIVYLTNDEHETLCTIEDIEETHEENHEETQEETHEENHEETQEETHEENHEQTHEETHEETHEDTHEETHEENHEQTHEETHEEITIRLRKDIE